MSGVRDAVLGLIELGVMPTERDADEATVRLYQSQIDLLVAPASDEEAVALVRVLPTTEESLFGLAWSVVHFIESAPSWPEPSALSGDGPWVAVLRGRADK
jgi:hypothetical protein